MRLNNYIVEEFQMDQTIESIKRDCKPWLYATKRCRQPFFFRGIQTPLGMGSFGRKKVRTDRKAMNMDFRTQQELDDLYEKKFGWRPRSEGIFCTSDYEEARSYGVPYFIFPIGYFKYIWNPNYEDLYTDWWTIFPEFRNDTNRKMEKIVDTTQDKNICGASEAGVEVVIKCKEYHYLRPAVIEVEKMIDKIKFLKERLYGG
jgi:hypothetical protein